MQQLRSNCLRRQRVHVRPPHLLSEALHLQSPRWAAHTLTGHAPAAGTRPHCCRRRCCSPVWRHLALTVQTCCAVDCLQHLLTGPADAGWTERAAAVPLASLAASPQSCWHSASRRRWAPNRLMRPSCLLNCCRCCCCSCGLCPLLHCWPPAPLHPHQNVQLQLVVVIVRMMRCCRAAAGSPAGLLTLW